MQIAAVLKTHISLFPLEQIIAWAVGKLLIQLPSNRSQYCVHCRNFHNLTIRTLPNWSRRFSPSILKWFKLSTYYSRWNMNWTFLLNKNFFNRTMDTKFWRCVQMNFYVSLFLVLYPCYATHWSYSS